MRNKEEGEEKEGRDKRKEKKIKNGIKSEIRRKG